MSKCKVITIDGVKYVREDQRAKMVDQSAEGREYCLVRTEKAGVFAGWIDREITGDMGTVFDARRIWYWSGAASLSELSTKGTSDPSSCKFPESVAEVDLKGVIEVLPCTEAAKESIKGVSVWTQT